MSKPQLRLPDLIRQALGALSTHRLRSFLTVLGVTIGVFSVVGVMTALSAVRSSIDTSLNVFGANVFQISREPNVRLTIGGRYSGARRPQITPRQAQEFKDRMDAEGILVTIHASDSQDEIKYRGQNTETRGTVIGTNENYILTNNYLLESGRNLSLADLEFNRPVAVIGYDVAQALFPNEDPVGRQVTNEETHYTIIGVLERKGEIFGRTMDNIMLVPLTRFVALNWGSYRSMLIAVQSPTPQQVAETQDVAIGHFRAVRGLEPGEENDFEISSNESLQRSFAEIAFYVGTGGLLISAIALVCSGIGIMNIMLVSVTERIREIGVRKSLGARKVDILRQFLLEATCLSEAGALLGILAGWGVGNVVAVAFGVPMIIPWLWMGVAVGVCSAIGIGFGFLPAWRAANLDPVEALRYE